MTVTKKAYTAGHFSFHLDDRSSESSAWLKSVEGGAVKGSVVTENVGNDQLMFRHLSTIEVEPITVEVAISAARPLLKWIQDSWKRERFSRRNGAVVHGDFSYKSKIEQWFYEALIAEVSFPALDANDKDPAYLNVKLHPERIELKNGSGDIRGNEGQRKGKMWTPAMFELDIKGIDCTRVSKIDAITVKQSITQMYTGANRYPELEPTGIEFPNLTLYVTEAYAQDFVEWHKKFVVQGAKDPEQEKTGHINFLDPSGNRILFSINLNRVGISSLTVEKSEANAEALKRVKVELYVDSLELEFKEGFEAAG
jgi:hypothetical protein